jgi:glycosyltransferase involved in cell wall biosynthesis
VRKHFPERRITGISHGTDLRQMINCDNLRDIVRPYIKELDFALALHEEQRAQIIDIFGMDESRVSVIGSGYNNKLFNTEGRSGRKDGEPLRLAYAGKISRPKGVPEMLAALERLAADSSVPAFELTMAGGCQDEVMQKKLGELPAWAEWLGQIPQSALAELLRRTDIFILPSYFEGLPLVLIEAMSAGAVPVSTDLPGIRSWINANVSGSNAVFVPMPSMKSIDEPSDEGRSSFIKDLASILKDTMAAFGSGALPGPLPDTSSITWDGLASRLLSICS